MFVTCLAAYTEKPAVGTSQFPVAATGNQQQVTRIKEPSSLIIDANRHYPNYNYPNSNHRHIQQRQSLHSNEPVLAYNDWSSGQMKNQTASVGRNATFECVFPDLKQDLRVSDQSNHIFTSFFWPDEVHLQTQSCHLALVF